MPKTLKRIGAALVALVVVVSAGTFIYIHFIEGKAPARLTLSDTPTTTAAPGSGSGSSTTLAGAASTSDPTGTWTPTSASQVGYRVKETLFGQATEAVGRTNAVTGSLVDNGNTITSVDLSVDLTKVTSDQGNRDNQFRTRIMNTSTYPTATFKLTKPIVLSEALGTTIVTASATGDLTMHGVTKSVTFDVKTRRTAAGVEVNGTIPITFADYGIANPTFGPAQVGDNGELEILVVFNKS